MCGFSNAVLLESTVDSVTGEEGLGAQRLVGLLAEVAGKAGSVEPLYTDMVAELDVINKVAAGDNYTSTFVAADKGELGSLYTLVLE